MARARARGRLTRSVAFLVPLALLLGAIGLRAQTSLFEGLPLWTFDHFQRLQPRTYQPVAVRIVDVDEESLARLGQWPWPRTEVAKLVRRLNDLGAAVIAFDMVFAEPDRTSPEQILPVWPATPELETLRPALEALPDHDAVLAEAIAEASVVTGFALIGGAPGHRPPARKYGFSTRSARGDSALEHAIEFTTVAANLEVLEAAAAGNGHFTPWPDRDGVIRRVPLVLRLGDRLYPTLALEALRVAQGARNYVITLAGASREASFGEQTGMVSVKVGHIEVPTDAKGRTWVYYTPPVPERTIPAWRVLDGSVNPEVVEGHIVFVGTSAAGLKDQRATPLNPTAAGVAIHAQLTEQVLAGAFLRRPDWAIGAEFVYLLVLGLLLILLLPRVGALWCALLGGAAILGVIAASWYAFAARHWLLDPVFPSLTALMIYLVSSLISFSRTETERRQVRDAFGRYLSPSLVERLAQHPEQLVLGGEMRTMTLLFADIRGFTTIAEQFTAQELTRFMNRFLTPMTQVILERQGTIDKYMGDCIMAFWNAPLDDADHARHACEAALAMGDALAIRNAQLRETAKQLGKSVITVRIGIGINTGECCVGNMGSDQRFDYSVLGDEVNVASRLEGQSKTYGVTILIGEQTHQQVSEYATLELDLITVKGKTRPVHIYGLLGYQPLKASEAFQALQARHHELLSAYRAQRWEEARKLAGECRKLDNGRFNLQTLHELYAARIEAYAANPPGAEWDGVFVAPSK